MGITLRDLQNRPNSPLVYEEQIAPNSWSYSLWVDESILNEEVKCNQCGDSEILRIVLLVWHSGPYPDKLETCLECGNDLLDRNLEVWC